MLEEYLENGFQELNIQPDPAAIGRFRIYHDYLEEINQVMNLTAISGEEDVARLHFLDCASLLGLKDFRGKRVIDVGTGAGFPGLVLKIAEPDLQLTLLDSLDKRINFLRSTCEKLELNDVKCIHSRAEEAPPEFCGAYDFAVSRAVARLNVLCELCLPFVKKGGFFIAMKGPDCEEELRESGSAIAVLGGELEKTVKYTVPGTDVTHAAVIIRKKAGTPEKYPRRWAQIKKQPL